MKIRLKVFASISDICGFSEKELDLRDSATLNDLIDSLSCQFPAIESRREHLLLAVNEDYCTPARVLRENDVVAIFPPVSGG